jgi:SAM-dependent methyltransferase
LSDSPYQLKRFKYNSHYWILKFLSEASGPLHILDVGTADGYLGELLKAKGHRVIGVEHDERLAFKARPHYDQLHVCDIEEFDFPYRHEFDVILFADVLEHLRDPAVVLRRSLASLKPTGEILISVPNIANWIIRIGLLFGQFNYSDRGILDRTHLRFFTLATLRKLLDECGCRIRGVAPTPIPVQLVFAFTNSPMFAPLHEAHFMIVRLCKTLFAYQFVVRGSLMGSGS